MKDNNDIYTVECVCTTERGLFIPNRRVTFIIAATTISLFCAFVAGYMTARYRYGSPVALESESPVGVAELAEQAETVEDASRVAAAQGHELADAKDEAMQSVSLETSTSELQSPGGESFYAQLIGFGTSPAAHRFAQRLQKKGLAVAVKTRYSKTPKGSEVTWYQVVTEPSNDRHALEQMVDQISRAEHLTGARIVSC